MINSLYQLLPAFKHFQIVYVGLRLGLPSALADGPLRVDELAALSHIPETRLWRLLRGLVWADILSYDSVKGFTLKEEARCLLDTAPTSLASSILFDGQFLYSAWGHFRDYIETGAIPFEQSQGTPIFDFLAANPELSREYSRPMSSRTSEYSATIANLSLFEGPKTIIDIGGGNGQLILDILKYRPELEGVIFDLPALLSDAESSINEAKLSERCRFQPGDMFSAVPNEGDIYILKWILHDWEDQHVRRILDIIRKTIRPEAVLVVIERVMDETPDKGTRLIQADLNMLVLSGGAERTSEEYSTLFASSKFRQREAIPIETLYGFSALIAEPV